MPYFFNNDKSKAEVYVLHFMESGLPAQVMTPRTHTLPSYLRDVTVDNLTILSAMCRTEDPDNTASPHRWNMFDTSDPDALYLSGSTSGSGPYDNTLRIIYSNPEEYTANFYVDVVILKQ